MKSKLSYYIIPLLGLLGLNGCVSDPDLPSEMINARPPEVKTLKIEGQTATTITISAEVVKENGMPVTDYGVYWSKTTPLDTAQAESISLGKGKGVFTATIEGLDNDSEYYLTPYARNKKGVGFGESELGRTIDGLGSVSTLAAQNITATTVDLGGKIGYKGEGEINWRGVVYWAVSQPELRDTVKSTMTTDSFICHITKLLPNTKYQAKAIVENHFGVYSGMETSFETSSGQPIVEGLTKVEIGFYDATFRANVTAEGDAPVTERGFCWKTIDDNLLPTIEHDTILCGEGLGVFEGKIENLSNDVRYQVRAFAKNKFGVVYSQDTIFSVKSDYPLLSNDLVVEMGKGSVEITAQVLSEGESAVIESGFCWSDQNPTPDLTDSVKPLSDGKRQFTGTLENLRGNTIYYVRAYAKNSTKTAFSKTVTTFRTPPIYTAMAPLNEDIIQGTTGFFYTKEAGFLLGGKKGPVYSNELWRYNLAQGNWVKRSPYPETTIVHGQTSVAINKKVYIFGGRTETAPNTFTYTNFFYEYDTYDDVWKKVESSTCPAPIAFAAGFNLGQSAYYIGGIRDNQVINEMSQYTPGEQWSLGRTIPVPQFGGVAVVLHNELFTGLGMLDVDRQYNNKKWWSSADYGHTWSERASIPEKASRIIGGVVYQNDIYVVDNNGQIWKYSTAENRWYEKMRLSVLNNEIHCIYQLDDKIYIGLGTGTGKFVAYSPYWDN